MMNTATSPCIRGKIMQDLYQETDSKEYWDYLSTIAEDEISYIKERALDFNIFTGTGQYPNDGRNF